LKEILSQQKSDTNSIQSIRFAYEIGIISSYSIRICYLKNINTTQLLLGSCMRLSEECLGTIVQQVIPRPVTSLGHQVGQRVFWKGPKFFELCPIVLNYVQHIFPEGSKNVGGAWPTCAPLVTGLVTPRLPATMSQPQRLLNQRSIKGCRYIVAVWCRNS